MQYTEAQSVSSTMISTDFKMRTNTHTQTKRKGLCAMVRSHRDCANRSPAFGWMGGDCMFAKHICRVCTMMRARQITASRALTNAHTHTLRTISRRERHRASVHIRAPPSSAPSSIQNSRADRRCKIIGIWLHAHNGEHAPRMHNKKSWMLCARIR